MKIYVASPLSLLLGILRDYHEDIEAHLAVRSPTFNINDLSMIQELLRRRNDAEEDLPASDVLEQNISTLTLTADAAQFDTDKVRVAHDTQRYAQFLQAGKKQEKKSHLLKVLHLKSMNASGAALVGSWMRRHSYHVCGDPEKSDSVFDQARSTVAH